MRVLKWMALFLTVVFMADAAAPIVDVTPIHEAFVSKHQDVVPPVIVSRPPPAPIQEVIAPRPSDSVIWIPGYFAWIESKNEFVWVCGVWRNPPKNFQWIEGSWVPIAGGFAWASGFWSDRPLSQLSFIEKAPPASIDDKLPPSPGNTYFWVRGYWSYEPATTNYSWLSGKWESFNANWVMEPATYYFRPTGYVFVPMHWDWNLEARGNAYSCSSGSGQAPLLLQPGVVIEQLFFSYPDYVDLHWHWWHFHPGWWGDCECVPPWWFWPNWWVLPWGDAWGLWWWWGHPGFLPPFWLSLELSSQIAPPPLVIIDMFKKISKPPFDIKLGNTPLLPKGTKLKDLPKPSIPNNVTPGGQVSVPPLPGNQVVIPPPPPPPPTPPPVQQPDNSIPPPQYEPPTYQPQAPNYYPQDNNPPNHFPPPPRDRHRPHYPPKEPQTPPSYQPPTGRNPKTPTYPQTPNYTPPNPRQPPKEAGQSTPSTNYPKTYTPNSQK